MTVGQLATLQKIAALWQGAGLSAYLVGGAVRDLLWEGRWPEEIDLVVEGNGAESAPKVAAELGCQWRQFPDFGTFKLLGLPAGCGFSEIDVVSARREIYSRPGSLPQVSPGTLADDLRRRDFSLNAMALPLSGLIAKMGAGSCDWDALLIDPAGGREDLKNGLIKVLHPLSFGDDPTRIFRAGRYAVRMEGSLAPATEQLLRETVAAGGLATISATRQLNEVLKILAEIKSAAVLELLEGYGVWEHYAIFGGQSAASWLQALSRLNCRSRAAGRDLRKAAAVVLWLSYIPEAFALLSAGGFGKKRCRELLAELPSIDSQVALPELSDLALLVLWARGSGSPAQVVAELDQRGYLL